MKRHHIFAFFLIIPFFMTGFTPDNAIVPKDEIIVGGSPKDGIPALLKPKFVKAEKADFLSPEDQMIGLVLQGQPKAYPIKILVRRYFGRFVIRLFSFRIPPYNTITAPNIKETRPR